MSAALFQAPGREARTRRSEGHHGGRPMRSRPHRGAGVVAVVDPARMDEVPFSELVCRLMFSRPKGADAAVWSRLLEADLVARTAGALRRALERNTAAVERRRAEWILYTEARVGVKVDAKEWQLAQQDFHDWCARAEKFSGVAAKALQEVERAERKHVRRGGWETGDSGHYRNLLQTVAEAIREHRAALDDGDVIAEEHDVRLWSVLDTVSVPHGRFSEHKTLAEMFDARIWGMN